MSRPAAFADFPKELLDRPGIPAVVDRVHDGDTYLCFAWVRYLDLFPYIAVRVAGYSAPELWEPGGDAAADKLRELLPRDEPLSLDYSGKSFNRMAMWTALTGGRQLHRVLGGEDSPGGVVAVEAQLVNPKVHDALVMPFVWPPRYDERGYRI